MTTLLATLLIASLAMLIAAAATGLGALLLGSGLVAARSSVVAALAPGETRADAVPRGGMAVLLRASLLALFAALAMLLAALVVRAVVAGRAPWASLHEFSVAFAAALLAAYLILSRREPIAALAPLVALLGAGLVAFALRLDPAIDPLVPALKQPLLLSVHVGSAAIAYALAGVAFLAAVAELGQRAAGDRIAVLPAASTMRAVAHRGVLLAFPVLTIAIVLGAVWANLAWRSYWSNDPKELAAAATWAVFGAYLHVAGRRDRWQVLAPWLIVAGFAGVLFTYVGASLFIVGEHSYAAP